MSPKAFRKAAFVLLFFCWFLIGFSYPTSGKRIWTLSPLVFHSKPSSSFYCVRSFISIADVEIIVFLQTNVRIWNAEYISLEVKCRVCLLARICVWIWFVRAVWYLFWFHLDWFQEMKRKSFFLCVPSWMENLWDNIFYQLNWKIHRHSKMLFYLNLQWYIGVNNKHK